MEPASQARKPQFLPGFDRRARHALFPIKEEGRWGYIEGDGARVLKPRYHCTQPFRDGLAWVKDEEWMAISEEGRVEITLPFDDIDQIWPLSNGWAVFCRRRSWMESAGPGDGEIPVFEGAYYAVNPRATFATPPQPEREELAVPLRSGSRSRDLFQRSWLPPSITRANGCVGHLPTVQRSGTIRERPRPRP